MQGYLASPRLPDARLRRKRGNCRLTHMFRGPSEAGRRGGALQVILRCPGAASVNSGKEGEGGGGGGGARVRVR